MKKKVLIYTAIILSAIILGIVAFLLFPKKEKKELISIKSLDNTVSLELCEIEVESIHREERIPRINFTVENGDDFVNNYVLCNEYFVSKYTANPREGTTIESFLFMKGKNYFSLSRESGNYFELVPCYMEVENDVGAYVVPFPDDWLPYGVIFNDEEEKVVPYQDFVVDISTYEELREWYAILRSEYVQLTEDEIILKCYDKYRRTYSESSTVKINQNSEMIFETK